MDELTSNTEPTAAAEDTRVAELEARVELLEEQLAALVDGLKRAGLELPR